MEEDRRRNRGKGAGDVREEGERRGEKRDSQGDRKWGEKTGKIMQHRAIFCNRKSAKRREATKKGGNRGLMGTGSGRFNPSLTPLQ